MKHKKPKSDDPKKRTTKLADLKSGKPRRKVITGSRLGFHGSDDEKTLNPEE